MEKWNQQREAGKDSKDTVTAGFGYLLSGWFYSFKWVSFIEFQSTMGFISLFGKQQLLNLQSISNSSEKAMTLGEDLGPCQINTSIARQGTLASPNGQIISFY